MFPASTRAVFSSPKEDTNIILRLTAGQCAVPLTVGPGGSASHVASAFATHSGLTLAQRVVADKSGETEVLLPLPEGLDPAPTLISLDALYARKSIAQSLVGNGADDLVALKKNNKRDHQQVVAQFGLSLDFPLPQTDLAYSHCLRNARSSEAIQDRGTDLDHRNLPIKVAGDKTLTRSFHTMHLCFDAASAVVPGQVSPARPGYFEHRSASFGALAPGVSGCHNLAFLRGAMTAEALEALEAFRAVIASWHLPVS